MEAVKETEKIYFFVWCYQITKKKKKECWDDKHNNFKYTSNNFFLYKYCF